MSAKTKVIESLPKENSITTNVSRFSNVAPVSSRKSSAPASSSGTVKTSIMIDDDIQRRMKILSVTLGRSLSDLWQEAAQDLLAKY